MLNQLKKKIVQVIYKILFRLKLNKKSKSSDAIKDKVSVAKDDTIKTPKEENVKLEITDTIQELETKLDTTKNDSSVTTTPKEEIKVETPALKLTTEVPDSPIVKSTNISFNDTDSIVKYDTKAKPLNTPEPENVTARTIRRN